MNNISIRLLEIFGGCKKYTECTIIAMQIATGAYEPPQHCFHPDELNPL